MADNSKITKKQLNAAMTKVKEYADGLTLGGSVDLLNDINQNVINIKNLDNNVPLGDYQTKFIGVNTSDNSCTLNASNFWHLYTIITDGKTPYKIKTYSGEIATSNTPKALVAYGNTSTGIITPHEVTTSASLGQEFNYTLSPLTDYNVLYVSCSSSYVPVVECGNAIFSIEDDILNKLTSGETVFVGNKYISADPDSQGTLNNSSVWNLYQVQVNEGEEYQISVISVGISSTGKTKHCVAFYDAELNFIEGTEPLTNANNPYEKQIEYNVTVPARAKYMYVGTHSSYPFDPEKNIECKKSDTPISVLRTKINKLYQENLNLDSIAANGVAEGNVYKFTRTFGIDLFNATTNMILDIFAKYDGTDAPTVSYKIGNIFQSPSYVIGSTKEFVENQWRMPVYGKQKITITITIPTGTTLYIKHFAANKESRVCNTDVGGLRLDAHLGFWGMCPQNTMAAVQMAQKAGYPACIVNVRVTKDNVYVCCHDEAINSTARNADGTELGATINISDKTYDELLEYDFGIYKHEEFKGTKILLLDDFFKLCAKTGMKPMFSTHPSLSDSQWGDIKAMLSKYNILHRFTIKSFDLTILQNAFKTFGNDIEGYILDTNAISDYGTLCDNLKAALPTAENLGLEIPFSEMTSDISNTILSKGLIASVWSVNKKAGIEYTKLANMGVTHVTDDFNCNYGLNY